MGLTRFGSSTAAVAAVLFVAGIVALAPAGAAQSDQIAPGFERNLPLITPDNRAHLRMLRPFNTGIWSMNISVRKTMRNVSISISALPNSSTAVPAPEDMVYRYINVSSPRLNSWNASSIDIVFPVNRSWMEKVKESSIRLNILEGGEWRALETSRYREEEKRVLYVASSSSVSYFAVTAEKGSDTGISIPVAVLGGVAALLLISYLIYSRMGGSQTESRTSEQRLGNLMQEIKSDLRERPVRRREELNTKIGRASELIDAGEYDRAEKILEEVKDSIEDDDY